MVTGRRRRDRTIPRKLRAGSFGSKTTVPSGCKKNFNRSPGFNPRCSRISFGIVAWPFTVIADSIGASHYIFNNVIPKLEQGKHEGSRNGQWGSAACVCSAEAVRLGSYFSKPPI